MYDFSKQKAMLNATLLLLEEKGLTYDELILSLQGV